MTAWEHMVRIGAWQMWTKGEYGDRTDTGSRKVLSWEQMKWEGAVLAMEVGENRVR